MQRRATWLTALVGVVVIAVQAAFTVSVLGSPGSGPTYAASAPTQRPPAAPATRSTSRDDAGLPDDLVGDGTEPPVREPTKPGTPLTARYGDHGTNWASRHTGLDFNGNWGDPVYAVFTGRITASYFHPAYGNMLVLTRDDGVQVYYAHLDTVLRSSGKVHIGKKIALMGSTGNSTGAHLHLEVRVNGVPTDPQDFLYGEHPGRPGKPEAWACKVYDC